jgi:adenylate cyclase
MDDFFAELRRRHIYRIGVAQTVIAALIALTCFLGFTSSAVAADRLPYSVAVLPFENVSPDPDDADFAEGIYTEILSRLAGIRNLNIIARTSVTQYPGSGKSIREIADELNVELVMEGSVRYAGDRVRITVQLIEGAPNRPIWTEMYDRVLTDAQATQTDVVQSVTNSVYRFLDDYWRGFN